MADFARMRSWASYIAAGVAILIVAAMVALRLMLPLVPRYQTDIRDWLNRASGYRVEFARLGATWPLPGPALAFYDVRVIDPADGQVLLSAREISAGVSLWHLLRDREVAVARVGVRGSAVALERNADGAFLLQGKSVAEFLRRRNPATGGVTLTLDDIRVDYRDAGSHRRSLTIGVANATLDVAPDHFEAAGSLDLPAQMGRRLRVRLTVPAGLHPDNGALTMPATWSASAAADDLDLVQLVELGFTEHRPLAAARGALDAQIRVTDRTVQSVTLRTSLRGVQIATGDAPETWERVSGQFAWARSAAGWDATAKELTLRRGGRAWPATGLEVHFAEARDAQPAQWHVTGGFLRLEDVYPVALVLAQGNEVRDRLPRRLRGELRDFDVLFGADPRVSRPYSIHLGFAGFGVTDAGGTTAVDGLTGSLAADGDGGRLQLACRGVSMDFSDWFRTPLTADSLTGLLSWRSGGTGLRIASDNVRLQTSGIDIRSRFALDFPADHTSPVIDLNASASARDTRDVLRYLPLKRFPAGVVGWLERAIVAGEVSAAALEFRGPLAEFPFDHGQGVFRVDLGVRNATLDYANGWPRVEGVDARVRFDGVSLVATPTRGRIGNLTVEGYDARIPDLRRGILEVSGERQLGVAQVFDFIRMTPIANALGPTFVRLSGGGQVKTDLHFALPLTNPREYELRVNFDTDNANVALAGLPVDLTRLRGHLSLHNTRLSGENITGVMLDEPVTLRIVPIEGEGVAYTHTAEFRGATPVARVMAAFHLPFAGYVAGNLRWSVVASLPARRPAGGPAGGGEPLRLDLRSDLRGVETTLPAPFAKAADREWPLQAELSFPRDGVMLVSGRVQPPLSWALRLETGPPGWRFERGTVLAGEGRATLPAEAGLFLAGGVAELRLEDWLRLSSGGSGNGNGNDARGPTDALRGATLGIGRLSVAGQIFRDVYVAARRDPAAWNVRIESANAVGDVTAPFDATAPIKLEMARLWLLEREPGQPGTSTDPRRVPPLEVRVDDAALGKWHVGGLQTIVSRTPDGLMVKPIIVRNPGFRVDAELDWRADLEHPERQESRLQARLESNDVADTLERFGANPAMTGKGAKLTVAAAWPGGPSPDFLEAASGQLSLEFTKGQVLDIEPGSGRLLGLLSIATLPRRLALDFRDLFQKGLAFDRIKGDFRLVAGTAYTCNLGLEGPSADMGIIGRTHLASHEYDQLAVVRPQVSTMLPVLGGAVLGGPVGGVTMLLISQVFRKSLSTLGESYYRVSGKWEKPVVDRLQRNQVDAGAFKDCERELAATLRSLPPVEPRPSGGP